MDYQECHRRGGRIMIYTIDMCVGCPPEMGCLGSCCSNRNVPVFRCDRCHDEDLSMDMHHDIDGQDVCDLCYEQDEKETI